MPILVFLGEVGLGAQCRQREETGACANRWQRRGLQPHRQWGQRQGQSLQLGQLVGLELLLQGRGSGELATSGPQVTPHPTPQDPRHTRMMEFSSGAVTCLALSMAPKTCCWCWKGVGWGGVSSFAPSPWGLWHKAQNKPHSHLGC